MAPKDMNLKCRKLPQHERPLAATTSLSGLLTNWLKNIIQLIFVHLDVMMLLDRLRHPLLLHRIHMPEGMTLGLFFGFFSAGNRARNDMHSLHACESLDSNEIPN
jgi:hypothetical protein